MSAEGDSLLKNDAQPPLEVIEAGGSASRKGDGGILGRLKFLMWLFCVCFSLAGVQFVYSIQFALGAFIFVCRVTC